MMAGTAARRAGFTMLELMIVSAIAVIMLTASISILSVASGNYQVLAPIDQTQELGRAALDRIAADLRAGQVTTVSFSANYPPAFPAADMRITRVVGYSAGPPIRALAGDNLMAPPGAASYQWQKNGVNISGATSQSYVTLSAGNYSVVGPPIPTITATRAIEYRLEPSPVDANGDGNTTDDYQLVRLDQGVRTTICHRVAAGEFIMPPVWTISWSAIPAGATRIPVWSTTGFSASGRIIIAGNVISYTGTTGWEFTGCTGVVGHPNGMAIYPYQADGPTITTSTYLASSIAAGAATIPVWSTAGFNTSGQIFIGGNAISYTGTDTSSWPPTFTGCTGAFAHPAWVPVYAPPGSTLTIVLTMITKNSTRTISTSATFRDQ